MADCEFSKHFIGQCFECEKCPFDKCPEDIFADALKTFTEVIIAQKEHRKPDYGCPKCNSNDKWAFLNDDKDIECYHCGMIVPVRKKK
jgi:hypothetical protein